MITNARRSVSVPLDAGTERVILGRADDGSGGAEGVVNGGSYALASLRSSIAAPSTVYLDVQAAPGASFTRSATSYTVPANGVLALELDGPKIVAAHALRLAAVNAAGGDLAVAWTIAR